MGILGFKKVLRGVCLLLLRGGVAILVIVGIVLVGSLSIFYFTEHQASIADEFLAFTERNEWSAARDLLCEDVREKMQPQDLRDTVQIAGIADIKESDWNNRNLTLGEGVTIVGTITKKSGRDTKLSMEFIKEDGNWKICTISQLNTILVSSSHFAKLPSRGEQWQLVRDTFRQFADSMVDRSMKKFRDSSSALFQKFANLEELDTKFRPFWENDTDWNLLAASTPKIEKELSINNEGFITIEGIYPTRPDKLSVKMTYVYEAGGWKTSGITFARYVEQKK